MTCDESPFHAAGRPFFAVFRRCGPAAMRLVFESTMSHLVVVVRTIVRQKKGSSRMLSNGRAERGKWRMVALMLEVAACGGAIGFFGCSSAEAPAPPGINNTP